MFSPLLFVDYQADFRQGLLVEILEARVKALKKYIPVTNA